LNLYSNRGSFTGSLLGFLFAFIFLAAAGYIYLRYGHPPAATADSPFPFEAQIVQIPLNARINRQLSNAPFSPRSEDLTSGAHIYVDRCAICHGIPGHNSVVAKSMYPPPPQLWEKNEHGTIGVSDDMPGQIYWKVANGIRLTGMPAFNQILSQTGMWQVALLLKRVNQPLPSSITAILDTASAARSAKCSS